MKWIKGLKIAALVPLGWMTLVLLAFGIGESMGGDWSGLGHFIPIVFVGLVAWLGWVRPLWGGAFLLAGALFETISFSGALASLETWLPPFLILILPLALAGLLYLLAGWAGAKDALGKSA